MPKHPERGDVDVMEPWASLPTDLLLEIFLSLEPTAVIRCASVCKPWRHAIIRNASILGRHLDRFGRNLLLGVFHHKGDAAYLRRTPGPFQSALPCNDDGDNETGTAHSFIPASSASSSGVDGDSYKELLCSSDGFMLLMARSGRDRRLCLCNPITGDCTFLPSAARGRYSTYLLLTSYDHLALSGTLNSNIMARVLAVHTRTRYDDSEFVFQFKAQVLSYQIFSTSGDHNAGKWGPVKRSAGELDEGLCVWMHRGTTVVCGDAVYWLAGPAGYMTCVLALDVCVGKTWITELPKQCQFDVEDPIPAILGTSRDGRLSFMQSLDWLDPKIQVWVLTGDAGWTLEQTIPMGSESLNAGGHVPHLIWFTAFCPRSQCMVVVSKSNKELLIDLGCGSPYPSVMCIGNYDGFHCCPYEIDSSTTYISKMKHFF